MRDLAQSFLTSKENLVNSGELNARTFADYYATCERLLTDVLRATLHRPTGRCL